MEQYSPEDFTRQSQRVRSPLSARRQRRLVRLAAVCGVMIAAGAALLMAALSGF